MFPDNSTRYCEKKKVRNASVDAQLPLAFDVLRRNEDCIEQLHRFTNPSFSVEHVWRRRPGFLWTLGSLYHRNLAAFVTGFVWRCGLWIRPDSLVTKGPTVKAPLRFCVNGGTTRRLCPLNLHLHRRHPSNWHMLLPRQDESVKKPDPWQYTPVTVMMNARQMLGCHCGRLVLKVRHNLPTD